MGVAEHGLRAFVSALGPTFTAPPVELSNWHNVIEQIERHIRELQKAPVADADKPAKSERLQRYSEAASHFFFVKEAWRNHIMHARTRYGR